MRYDARTAFPDAQWIEAIRNVRFIEYWAATATGWSWPEAPVDRRWRNDRIRGKADGRLRLADDRKGVEPYSFLITRMIVSSARIARKLRSSLYEVDRTRCAAVYKNVAASFLYPCVALHLTAMAKVRGRRKQLMMQLDLIYLVCAL
jgi:hypothetical protein